MANPLNTLSLKKRGSFDIETWGIFIMIAHFPYFNKLIHKLITSEDTLLISYSDYEDKVTSRCTKQTYGYQRGRGG